jgi:hypothetical protein
MTTLSARFVQSPNERRRYLLDYTLDLASGETIVSMSTPVIVNGSSNPDPEIAPLVIDSIAIAPGALQVAFFASGGDNTGTYEVQFLATTSIGQIREDVIEFDIQGDL